MEPNNAHRIFLDASILRVCSLGNADLQYLWIFPFCKLPLQCVTSSYVLAETLAALAEPDVPPKSRIAVLNGLGLGLLQTGWHVRLPEPSLDAIHAMQTFCRDPEDWPVLADALAESCSVVLTYDKDLLEADAPVRCVRPAMFFQELCQDQEFVGDLQALVSLLSASQDSDENALPQEPAPDDAPDR